MGTVYKGYYIHLHDGKWLLTNVETGKVKICRSQFAARWWAGILTAGKELA